MKSEKAKSKKDISTEEKIINAARIVFHKKGYAASRTRDIAEEAGINLALLNYYFRSKEKLFNIVMLETFQNFFNSIFAIFNNVDTSLEEKIENFASQYIDLLFREPEIPLFIMNEIQNNANKLLEQINIKNSVFNSEFVKQYNQAVNEGRIQNISFLHFMMNFMGLIIFPFVAKPLFKEISGMNEEEFNAIIEERKRLIPVWLKSIITV